MNWTRMSKLVGLTGLAVAVVVFAGGHNREAFAANKVVFAWSQYDAKDGKKYNYPRWNDNNGKRELESALGTLYYAQTPPVTNVVFKVYQRSKLGGWNANPTISYTLNPAPTYSGDPINGWILVGKDNNVPKIQFDEGEQLMIVWEITTTDNGVKTLTTEVAFVTVEYHAW